jgi:hypothetical protein
MLAGQRGVGDFDYLIDEGIGGQRARASILCRKFTIDVNGSSDGRGRRNPFYLCNLSK